MKRFIKAAYGLGLAAAVGVGVWAAAPASAAKATAVDSCRPCSGFFFFDGAICYFASCNNGPCNELICLDF